MNRYAGVPLLSVLGKSYIDNVNTLCEVLCIVLL
jgi:hypothetical protein